MVALAKGMTLKPTATPGKYDLEIRLDMSEGECGEKYPGDETVACTIPVVNGETWHRIYRGHIAPGPENEKAYRWPVLNQ